jgi:hypothetical protein
MLGNRPLWITLTYPRDWRRRVPDGRAFEAHRRAFGERWRRNFGEPVGFWTKEFQLAEGRPHLHLLMKGPDSMPEADYRGFQERTRLAKTNERTYGKYHGRAKTEAISVRYGGATAMTLRRWWAEIVTGNTDRMHHVRGVDVRTVFYSHDDAVALSKRRAAIAAYLAGETAKAKQKVPPDGFGTVGNYYGHWGRAVGFRPQVTAIEVDREVWDEMNRRLARLQAWQRGVRRRKGAKVNDDWKRRRDWQGLTIGGLGPEELARLLVWSTAAAQRRKARDAQALVCSCQLVEDLGGTMDHAVFDGVDVAAHRGSRVGVTEDLLDVEEVEVMGSVIGDSAMQDPGCRPPEVVRADVAEARLPASFSDNLGDAGRALERLTP